MVVPPCKSAELPARRARSRFLARTLQWTADFVSRNRGLANLMTALSEALQREIYSSKVRKISADTSTAVQMF